VSGYIHDGLIALAVFRKLRDNSVPSVVLSAIIRKRLFLDIGRDAALLGHSA
jgi:hypothetical protein